jgi:Ca2+-binding RTX toxin-like protein
MPAWNQSITLDNINHVVSGSQGNATIHAGSGNNAITASGYNNVIVLGDGINSVTGPQGNTSVIVGNGQNTITLQGYGNSVTTGSGTNIIVAGAGNETVNTSSGHDTVTLSGYSNRLIGGLGHSTFIGGSGNTYEANGVSSSGGMDITGFTLNNSDLLDVSKLLAQAGWKQAASDLTNFLKVSEVGQDTIVAVDMTGHGSSFATLATLHNLGAASLGDLQAQHSISLF